MKGPLEKAFHDCRQLVLRHDKNSFILAHYIPEPVRNCYFAVRAFNIETNRVQKPSTPNSLIQAKFKVWDHQIIDGFQNLERSPQDPSVIVFQHYKREGYALDLNNLRTVLQAKCNKMQDPTFSSVEEICQFGESTQSQMTYLVQGLLQSSCISPSSGAIVSGSQRIRRLTGDIAAHLGQASSVASVLKSVPFYAIKHNVVTLPCDVMTEHNISQEEVLRHFQNKTVEPSQLRDVAFETAIAANDHLLSARSKLVELKEELAKIAKQDGQLQEISKKWRGGIPDALYVPFMSSIPVDIYLKCLEKGDFHLQTSNTSSIIWRSAWNYYTRRL